MSNETVSAAYLLRLTGLFGIAVGVAWAVQTMGFSASTLTTSLVWVVAAASMSGAGAGLLIAARELTDIIETKGDRHSLRLEPVFD